MTKVARKTCVDCGGIVKNLTAKRCRACYAGKAGANEKVCTVCRAAKPLSAFKPRVQYRYGVSSVCRECENIARRKLYWKAPEKARANVRVNRLKTQYGLTQEKYAELVASGCHICGGQCKTGRRLAVDHCHKTGKVRGVLCANCNRALGMFQENPDVVKKALRYLKSRG